MFITNKRTSKAWGARKSWFKEVGILDPGPITNHLLFDDAKPMDGLVKGQDYRGVNREVWQLLYNTYGGGPVIRRREVSIYADEVNDHDLQEDTEIDSIAIK